MPSKPAAKRKPEGPTDTESLQDARDRWIDAQDRLAFIEKAAQKAAGVYDCGALDCIAILLRDRDELRRNQKGDAK